MLKHFTQTCTHHGEELARWHHHMIPKPPGNNTVMHNRLVRLILEVTIPSAAKLLARPAIHHVELFLRRPDLDAGFDAVGGEGPRAVDVPLLEDLFLHFGVTAHKVVEGFDVWFCAVGCECEAWVG
jgi:hypothetical protein